MGHTRIPIHTNPHIAYTDNPDSNSTLENKKKTPTPKFFFQNYILQPMHLMLFGFVFD
jgi:hypothetical protein